MIEVLKQLVDALENHSAIKHPQQIHYRDAAIQAGKQAIAQLALDAKAENARELGLDYEQEPVACVHIKDGCLVGSHRDQSKLFPDGQYGLWPINTHPPQRTWVGLTVEEIAACCMESTTTQLSFYNAIEAKLKQKNGFAEENT